MGKDVEKERSFISRQASPIAATSCVPIITSCVSRSTVNPLARSMGLSVQNGSGSSERSDARAVPRCSTFRSWHPSVRAVRKVWS